MMFFVDAHLDMAYNAMVYGRDLRQPLADLRRAEGLQSRRGVATVTFPALRRAGVALIFGTLFTPPAGIPNLNAPADAVYHDADGAHKRAMAQLDYYHRLADAEEGIRLVGDVEGLTAVLRTHAPDADADPLLGIVPLMEGADPIRHPEEVEEWYERGLRLVGLAWDDTRYAAGAWREGGGLSDAGRDLLEALAEFGFIVDLTHMSEEASMETLDRYEGAVVATHSNARALVSGQRQLSDTQIEGVGERDGVIGVVLYNRFLREGHQKGEPKEWVTLDHVVAHIDHICQVLGDAAHVGIGSDFDGGFGAADIPKEMDSIADLERIAVRLGEKGYEPEHIAGVMGGNWVKLLQRAWT
jgi:membrane dipeptidase